jgi:hypothetical protein
LSFYDIGVAVVPFAQIFGRIFGECKVEAYSLHFALKISGRKYGRFSIKI